MNRISLTSSMRSNLLSLQNISRQVSSTQNKLATGNKVNSAIDNPSSYYTARSLNNRADDLNALLDSMGQAVSTIKAATTALETGADFLEQAAAVATSALEPATVPAKSYFADKGTVVTTAQELKDAVASGKETIIVYGKIDYFANENITLKAGQKLVGTEYFTGYSGREKFSQINFSSDIVLQAVIMSNNSLLSDLSINYNNNNPADASISAVYAAVIEASVNNTDIKIHYAYDTNVSSSHGIRAQSGSNLVLSGHINIANDSNKLAYGMIATIGSSFTFASGSQININNTGNQGYGIYIHEKSSLNVLDGAEVNINMPGSNATGIHVLSSSRINAFAGSSINVNAGNIGLWVANSSSADLYGRLNLSGALRTIYLSSSTLSNILNIHNGAEVSMASASPAFLYIGSNCGLSMESGAKIEHNGTYLLSSGYANSTTSMLNISDFLASGKFSTAEKFATIDWNNWSVPQPEEQEKTDKPDYDSILQQYDQLIKDASYKGINLLQSDELGVKFNESGSAALKVKGRDMSSAALGLQMMDWQTQGDIAQSLSEISAALKSIRSFSAELGNNYSIITSRQDFTENLINILTEGADKLTLADMNEETANMLALQTRQQLAINSLSLASQASQAVLKLF